MDVDSLTLSSLALIGAGFTAAFLAALWGGLVIWTYRDIRSRTRDVFMRILAVLLVLVLTIPGTLIYLLLRPKLTLYEEYQHNLEEEALLQTLEDIPHCPGCNRKVQTDWQICPSCNTRLMKPCHHCGNLLELSWNLCPYCATPIPGMRRENISLEEALMNLPHEPHPAPPDESPDAEDVENGHKSSENVSLNGPEKSLD